MYLYYSWSHISTWIRAFRCYFLRNITYTTKFSLNDLLLDPFNSIHPILFHSVYILNFLIVSLAFYYFIPPVKQYERFRLKTQLFRALFPLFPLTTLMLATGSWWSFQESTWGSWWEWDISENLALFPLLTILAIWHHSRTRNANPLYYLKIIVTAAPFFGMYFLVQLVLKYTLHNFDNQSTVFLIHYSQFVRYEILLFFIARLVIKYNYNYFLYYRLKSKQFVNYFARVAIYFYFSLLFCLFLVFLVYLHDNDYTRDYCKRAFDYLDKPENRASIRYWSFYLYACGFCFITKLTPVATIAYCCSAWHHFFFITVVNNFRPFRLVHICAAVSFLFIIDLYWFNVEVERRNFLFFNEKLSRHVLWVQCPLDFDSGTFAFDSANSYFNFFFKMHNYDLWQFVSAGPYITLTQLWQFATFKFFTCFRFFNLGNFLWMMLFTTPALIKYLLAKLNRRYFESILDRSR